MADKISKLITAHDRAIDAAIKWAAAAARGNKTEMKYARYELTEKRFDLALAQLQDDIVRNPDHYR